MYKILRFLLLIASGLLFHANAKPVLNLGVDATSEAHGPASRKSAWISSQRHFPPESASPCRHHPRTLLCLLGKLKRAAPGALPAVLCRVEPSLPGCKARLGKRQRRSTHLDARVIISICQKQPSHYLCHYRRRNP